MNTNRIKYFAKEARINLLNAVEQQLRYWGFDHKGKMTEAPHGTAGGYTFRGKAFDDTSIMPKWNKLKNRVSGSQEAFTDVVEEAAYTWFNRLMAIKILEENGFIEPVLSGQQGSTTPAILQMAKAGESAVSDKAMASDLSKALIEHNEEKAFAILIINYCNRNGLLKQVFGKIDDYTELLIPQNLLAPNGFLSMLYSGDYIEEEDYHHVELIGWLYQFYISDKKDEVFAGFKKNKKARAEDIPAATQIFTPKWIVNYMVENTLGKLYLDFEPDSELKDEMRYLVENEEEPGNSLINNIEELNLIDPACGSGHILVAGFEWLYKMYREQGYTAKQAVESILKNNLYGLDIDERAVQLARFAVLLKAAIQLRKVSPGQGKEWLQHPILPHVYAFPEAYDFTMEHVSLFTSNQKVGEIGKALNLLKQGKNIGSALKLQLSVDAMDVLQESYDDWSKKDKNGKLNIEEQSLWNYLKEYAEVALVLSDQYTSVVANPPYMGQKSMNGELKEYVNRQYPKTKADLFAVFMEVCINLTKKDGRMGMINQHSWMFLSSFETYRKHLLTHSSIESMLHLGPRTFDELSGEVVQSTTFALKNTPEKQSKACYYRLVDYRSKQEKENNFLIGENFYPNVPQANFEKIPGSPIAYWAGSIVFEMYEQFELLEDVGLVRQGASTSDNDRFLKLWHEVSIKKVGLGCLTTEESIASRRKYFPYNKGGSFRKWYGNLEFLINYEHNAAELKSFQSTLNQGWTARLKSREYYFLPTVSWSKITAGGFSARYYFEGTIFDVAGCCYFPYTVNYFYVLGLLNSKVASLILNFLSPTLNFEIEHIKKIPFIFSATFKCEMVEQCVVISQKDWNSRETSWDFEKNPLIAEETESLTEAFQEWQTKAKDDFFKLHRNEEELNRIFIDIYGLQDELTPEVALKDITILQDELKPANLEAMEPEFRAKGKGGVQLPIQREVVMAQLLSYLIGVLLGRYRLDKTGLHIAHPKPTEEELADYQVANVALPFTMKIDEDAIIPLMGNDCAFPDDVFKKIEFLVHHIWGEESLTENLNFINDCLGMPMEKWLTEKFWPWHISGTMYKKKPIYWLFCSNPKRPHLSAFRVLVYMHRMDAYTIQNIMRKYLHPHQEHVRGEFEKLRDNEAGLSRTEQKRLEELQRQLVELKDYAEVLKALANQQITFDLDDGVTVNYAKFAGAVAEI